MRNKENPELERIPRAPGGLQMHRPARARPAPRPPAPSCAPPALPLTGPRGRAPPPPGRGSLRGASASPARPPPATPAPHSRGPGSSALRCSRPTRRVPARRSLAGPPALRSPEGASELPPGGRTPQRVTQRRGVGPVPPDWPSPLPASRGAGPAVGGRGGGETEEEASPREVTPKVPKSGVAMRGPSDRP